MLQLSNAWGNSRDWRGTLGGVVFLSVSLRVANPSLQWNTIVLWYYSKSDANSQEPQSGIQYFESVWLRSIYAWLSSTSKVSGMCKNSPTPNLRMNPLKNLYVWHQQSWSPKLFAPMKPGVYKKSEHWIIQPPKSAKQADSSWGSFVCRFLRTLENSIFPISPKGQLKQSWKLLFSIELLKHFEPDTANFIDADKTTRRKSLFARRSSARNWVADRRWYDHAHASSCRDPAVNMTLLKRALKKTSWL